MTNLDDLDVVELALDDGPIAEVPPDGGLAEGAGLQLHTVLLAVRGGGHPLVQGSHLHYVLTVFQLDKPAETQSERVTGRCPKIDRRA